MEVNKLEMIMPKQTMAIDKNKMMMMQLEMTLWD